MFDAVDVGDSCAHWSCSDSSGSAVDDTVRRVLQSVETHWKRPERRQHRRYPYPQLLTLTPIADHDVAPIGEPLTVVGKNLALRGLDFYHGEPLPHRRMIVSFDGFSAHLVLIVSWCRFLRPGWYDSGGRFTHVVTPGEHQEEAIKRLT